MSDERWKSYDIVGRQFHTIFIACVTMKVVQVLIVRQKVSDIQGGPKISHYRESSLNRIKNRQPG